MGGHDKRDPLWCECRTKMWLCLVPVVAWRPSVELLKFLRLLSIFGGKRPPKGPCHYDDLRRVLKRNEVHCLSIGVQNIEVDNHVNMGDTIQTNMQQC